MLSVTYCKVFDMRFYLHYLSKFLIFVSVLLLSVISAHSEIKGGQTVIVDIDFMEGFEFKKPAGQIILGNPIIADITVRDDKYVFISGKSPGRTNMVVYGRDGKVSERYILVVRDPNAYLTVYQGGMNKVHFDCEPLCQRVLRIEDSGEAAEAQRSKIQAQIEMIDGRARQAKAEEAAEQQQKGQ